jgi:hypothetical protein
MEKRDGDVASHVEPVKDAEGDKQQGDDGHADEDALKEKQQMDYRHLPSKLAWRW